MDQPRRRTAHGRRDRRVVPLARDGHGSHLFAHLPNRGTVRLRLLDSPVHARQCGGDAMTQDPHTMTRRQLIRHTAWFGAAVGLAVAGGEVISHVAGAASAERAAARPAVRFAQISDSHIGFTGTANPDVASPFSHAIDRVNSLGYTPDFVIHTGDLTHLSSAEQFDQVNTLR